MSLSRAKKGKGEKFEPMMIEREGRFHMLCFRYTVERLLPKVRNLFRGDNLSRLVNCYIRKLEPFLVYHMNQERVKWEFSLKWGNVPENFEYIYDDDGKYMGKIAETMTEHLYIKLDYRNYKLLKKFHEVGVIRQDYLQEGGGAGGSRTTRPCNTFSMAKILRAVLTFCLDGIEQYGAGVFWKRMRKWTREHCKEYADKTIPLPTLIASHMLSYKEAPTEMISEYGADYRHKELKYFHPPPEES